MGFWWAFSLPDHLGVSRVGKNNNPELSPMRHHGEIAPPLPGTAAPARSDWTTLRRLLPYLWQYKWRVVAAIVFMVGAKLANVGVPLLLKTLEANDWLPAVRPPLGSVYLTLLAGMVAATVGSAVQYGVKASRLLR